MLNILLNISEQNLNFYKNQYLQRLTKDWAFENRDLWLNLAEKDYYTRHCVKSVRIQSYSGPYFPTFGLNTEKYRIQAEYEKIRTKITPNTDTFHAARTSMEDITSFQLAPPSQSEITDKTMELLLRK